MDPQHWAAFQDPAATAARQSRYPPHGMPPQQPVHADHGAGPPAKQDPYAPMTIGGRAAPSLAPTSAPPHAVKVEYGDTDGDINMEDIAEYKPKMASGLPAGARSAHQRMPSSVKDEESTAARRYSPMNMSPTMTYATASQPAPQVSYSNYTPQGSARTSPTRTSYVANSSYYSPPSACLPLVNSLSNAPQHQDLAPLSCPLYSLAWVHRTILPLRR
jgi:dual specificity protein kinase YAK1